MKSILPLFLFLLCSSTYALQSQYEKTDNPKVLKSVTKYYDAVIAWERFYGPDKKLDSSKTYYKSGAPDELFYFDRGRYHGTSYKLNTAGDTITTWLFNKGKLVERKDLQLDYTSKTENKVRAYVARLAGFNEEAKKKPNDIRLRYNIASARNYLKNKTLAFRDLKSLEKSFTKIAKNKKIPEKKMGRSLR